MMDLKFQKLNSKVDDNRNKTRFDKRGWITASQIEQPVFFTNNESSDVMQEEIFITIMDGIDSFLRLIKSYQQNDKEIQFAQALCLLLKTSLKNHEIKFKRCINSLDPIEFPLFWKEFKDNKIAKKVLLMKIGFMDRLKRIEIGKILGKTYVNKLIDEFREFVCIAGFSKNAQKLKHPQEYEIKMRRQSDDFRGLRIEGFNLWGKRVDNDEYCPKCGKTMGRLLITLRETALADELPVCFHDQLIILTENLYLRIFEDFRSD